MKKNIFRFILPVIIIPLFLTITLTKCQTINNEAIQEIDPLVKIAFINGQYQILRNGEPYFIKGAGTFLNLKEVKEFGGNSIRTWDTSDATRILDEAHELGLTVNLGIWLTRQRDGFSFYNNKLLEEELKRVKNIIHRYKDHPALLMWSIGNEMAAGNPGIRMYDILNDIAKMIHEIDPHHPVTTPIYSIDIGQLRIFQKRCPDIDLLSFNVYGSIESVTKVIEKSPWRGPYVISEYGAKGYWESPKTAWDEPFEQTSSEKATFVNDRYNKFVKAQKDCLGSYIFFWGNKVEKTHTWYSLFSPSGEKSELVDLMQFLWNNSWPENRAPIIKEMVTDGYEKYESIILSPGDSLKNTVIAIDYENDSLTYHWEVLPELTTKDGSIEKHQKPRAIKNLISAHQGHSINWKAPEKPGAYRLYVSVYDGNNNFASANVPFHVGPITQPNSINFLSRFFFN
jgi:hypothetical protein